MIKNSPRDNFLYQIVPNVGQNKTLGYVLQLFTKDLYFPSYLRYLDKISFSALVSHLVLCCIKRYNSQTEHNAYLKV